MSENTTHESPAYEKRGYLNHEFRLFHLRGLTGMILAVPVGLVFINFYKYGAFDSMIRNFRMLMESIQKFRREE